MKVSLKDAKMCATPKTYSPSRTVGPSVTFSSLGSRVFLLPDCTRKTRSDQHRRRNDGEITEKGEAGASLPWLRLRARGEGGGGWEEEG
jgi:hypothetical protein